MVILSCWCSFSIIRHTEWIYMQTHCYGSQFICATLPFLGNRYFICKHSIGENKESIQDTIVSSFLCSKYYKIKWIFGWSNFFFFFWKQERPVGNHKRRTARSLACPSAIQSLMGWWWGPPPPVNRHACENITSRRGESWIHFLFPPNFKLWCVGLYSKSVILSVQ